MKTKNKKKKLPAKKVSKRIIARSKPQSNSMALATVSYSDIIRPDIFEGAKDKSLHLLASYFPDRVLKFITQPTPAKYIQKRPGTGGKEFDYVSGWYAKKCANYAFGFNHSFEIKAKEICGTSAIVEGRFIVTDPKTGREIFHKDDIGGHQIRFIKDKAHTAENAVDIANDYKSAATDALKRCMAQIGFFMDVYGVGEAKEDGNYVNGRPEEHQQATPAKPAPAKQATIDVTAKPVGTDYLLKLDATLLDKGLEKTSDKIVFVKKTTGFVIKNYSTLTQKEAQLILAMLARRGK